MRNIAIALNSGTPVARNEITNFFSSKGWAYWHWVDDFWIVQVPDEYTPKVLYQKLVDLPRYSRQTILLFEFKGRINYWGTAPKDAWEWLEVIGKPE
jgi:hypothetical protein